MGPSQGWDTRPSPPAPRAQTPAHLTCTKAQKRGSLRCLALSCSKANDWWLQKREEIFWNHLPSAPSNYSEIQAREGSQVGAGKAEPHPGVGAETGGQGWGPGTLASRPLAGRRGRGPGLSALTRASSTSPISLMR